MLKAKDIPDAIPEVVQKALGTIHLKPSPAGSDLNHDFSNPAKGSNGNAGVSADGGNGIIHGLQGYLLPEYLLIRLGHYEQQQERQTDPFNASMANQNPPPEKQEEEPCKEGKDQQPRLKMEHPIRNPYRSMKKPPSLINKPGSAPPANPLPKELQLAQKEELSHRIERHKRKRKCIGGRKRLSWRANERSRHRKSDRRNDCGRSHSKDGGNVSLQVALEPHTQRRKAENKRSAKRVTFAGLDTGDKIVASDDQRNKKVKVVRGQSVGNRGEVDPAIGSSQNKDKNEFNGLGDSIKKSIGDDNSKKRKQMHDGNSADCGEDILGKVIEGVDENASARKKGRRKKRRKRRKRTGNSGATDGSAENERCEENDEKKTAALNGFGCADDPNNATGKAPPATIADASAENNPDWLQYQMMARVIVAPFTSSLISIMRKRHNANVERKNREEEVKQVRENRSGKEVRVQQAGNDINPAIASNESSTLETRTMKGSTALPASATTHNSNCTNGTMAISPQRESLESIVDAAICTLVRRTHRIRSRNKGFGPKSVGGVKSNGRKENGELSKAIRRRQRRKKSSQSGSNDPKQTPSNNTKKESFSNDPPKAANAPSPNDWLLEQNLLSTGYSLGNGETYQSPNNPNSQILRGCPKMAPGVHCLQPNTLASYARSCHFMKMLHMVVGDDLLREILLNCVVLIPAIPVDGELPRNDGDEDCDSDACNGSLGGETTLSAVAANFGTTNVPAGSFISSPSVFDRGNFFQLCGPPLHFVTKKFDKLNSAAQLDKKFSNTPIKKGDVNQRKRKRREIDSFQCLSRCGKVSSNTFTPKGGTDSMSNQTNIKKWDPNRPIPRSKLFYCDFYTKRVGLSPKHLLNQPQDSCFISSSKIVDSNSDMNADPPKSEKDVNIKLLNAMVHLWPKNAKTEQPSPGLESAFIKINHRHKRRNRWRRLRESGLAMCQEMRRRQKQCDYARLLNSHCPLPLSTAPENEDAKTELSHLVTLHTSDNQVCSFLQQVLRKAFPATFWGSKHNFYQVVKTMNVFVKLHRAEQLPEKAIMKGIRVLDMKWLHSCHSKKKDSASSRLSRSNHECSTILTRFVIRWLYCQFIIPLLRSSFYITETEFTGSRVVYYRKPTWTKIKSLSMKILLRKQYKELNLLKAHKLLASHNVGCAPAPLRLLPKKTGIRAIAMLSKSFSMEVPIGQTSKEHRHSVSLQDSKKVLFDSITSGGTSSPPNKTLQSTFHAVQYEYDKKPSLFGAGVLGLTDVLPSFCMFLDALKQKIEDCGQSSAVGVPYLDVKKRSNQIPLYFTSVDVRHCYDTINQKRLFKLMSSVLEEDQYLTQNQFVLYRKNGKSSLNCNWKKLSCPPSKFSNFVSTTNTFAEKYSQSIFVDGVNCSVEKRTRIMALLRDHVFGQIMVASGSYGNRYLLQKNGIPQGSVMSSSFCNIYFGDLEKFMLDNVFEEDALVIKGSIGNCSNLTMINGSSHIHLLVRIVDDFLLVSTDKATSCRFLRKLNKGIPSLGVKINKGKTRVNYQVPLNNEDVKEIGEVETLSGCHNDQFLWCGLAINTRTFEIGLDMGRFSEKLVKDTVTIHRSGNEGWNLRKKMKDFVKPRCSQKLLFSSIINGLDTIRINFYHTILICAVKTMRCLKNGDCMKNRQFIYNCVCDTIGFAYSLISSKMKHTTTVKPGDQFSYSQNGSSFQLVWCEALWLGKHAFSSVIKKEGKKYASLQGLFSKSKSSVKSGDLVDISRRALAVFLFDEAKD